MFPYTIHHTPIIYCSLIWKHLRICEDTVPTRLASHKPIHSQSITILTNRTIHLTHDILSVYYLLLFYIDHVRHLNHTPLHLISTRIASTIASKSHLRMKPTITHQPKIIHTNKYKLHPHRPHVYDHSFIANGCHIIIITIYSLRCTCTSVQKTCALE